MGVDLTLMPLLTREYPAAHQMIDLARNYELWDEISKASKPYGQPVSCFRAADDEGNSKYGEMHETPYGEPLHYVLAGDLAHLRHRDDVQEVWQNRAAFSYIREMPNDWPIVLYWH